MVQLLDELKNRRNAARPGAPRRPRAQSLEYVEPQQSLLQFARKQSEKADRRSSPTEKKQSVFDTPEMLAARRALKHNPDVLDALQDWWIATDADCSGAIDKLEYIELLKAIYRVKVSEDDEEDCQKCAEEDAEDDFVGIEEMTEPRFHESIFELADRTPTPAPPLSPPSQHASAIC